MTDISERVSRILQEHLGATGEKLTPDARLCDDLGADSLDYVELAMALEDEFGIDADDEEMGSVVTVADLVHLVISAVPQTPAPVVQAPRKSWWMPWR